MELSAFTGTWRIERRIEDFRAGRTGPLTGTARFDPLPDGLRYLETGTLSFAGTAPIQASRRYLWRDGGAGTIDVFFDDGRFFHRFDAEAPAPAAAHDCPPDRYRVRYDFRGWPRWEAEWRVTGPRKDYAMLTSYTAAPGPRAGR
ncbi:MAG TPA: DUF6314 family protein [Amaricoccus sp.]|uniref:DUF6314 family protein n=1 Tax=Amaricoccus sp. TaxID=1872485 RepID=UPI002C799AC2|nr:DUF6314 family protein [Amaricoccus sp.]HMQ92428.1 DUF6314 family protein [Amaricoccus sp.]HMR52928.1 DUF6314 family protein [Amaricoccus sp.]HMR60849.1 DUF6314 family protein [Amaricoccus sp.]HMT99823.1 DUF6314 family protein [Amaricoccus sp.]